MQTKLYLDEDSQAENLLKALQRHNIDVLTTNEAKMTGSSDLDQLEFANSQNRTIYTFNTRDFLPLHYEFLQTNQTHSGIILGEQGRFGTGEQLRRLLRIINATSAEEMKNELEFLSNW
jgi:Domain of unknown function (DUF5615)